MILYLLVPSQWTTGTQRRHLSINIHWSKTEINIAMVFREETTHWDEIIRKADAALKKNHACYVLQINTNIKFTIKYTPIQHSARSGKRCIEVTNRDEYKNITTRNVLFFFRCRLVFCNRKLMRTDIFFTRTTKPICNFGTL
jgi:hypothetical protein